MAGPVSRLVQAAALDDFSIVRGVVMMTRHPLSATLRAMHDQQGTRFDAELDRVHAGTQSTRAGCELIVRRPAVDEREIVDEARLDLDVG